MSQGLLDVERIRQYLGQIQVARRVKVQVPGKHFPPLTAAEQKQFFEGTAVEYAERHKFAQRAPEGLGSAHTSGPGKPTHQVPMRVRRDRRPRLQRLLDHGGTLEQRWRHETYKDDRDAEK